MKKLIFIHIPRTGGNSVSNAMTDEYINPYYHNLRDKDFTFYHETEDKGDFIFTIVRDPFQRAFSAYKYLRFGGNNPLDATDAYQLGIKNLSFEEFVFYRLEDASHWQIHFIPQHKWLQGVTNLKILRFENLSNEFSQLCKMFNIPERKLPILNNTIEDFNDDIYENAKVKEKIKLIYKIDYKNFSY